LPGLSLNLDPPNLHLPSSWDFRHEPMHRRALSRVQLQMPWYSTQKIHHLLHSYPSKGNTPGQAVSHTCQTTHCPFICQTKQTVLVFLTSPPVYTNAQGGAWGGVRLLSRQLQWLGAGAMAVFVPKLSSYLHGLAEAWALPSEWQMGRKFGQSVCLAQSPGRTHKCLCGGCQD
jgi:hypothetical protein